MQVVSHCLSLIVDLLKDKYFLFPFFFFGHSLSLEIKHFYPHCPFLTDNTTHLKERPNCLFLFIDLVICLNQGARPNYVAFVLVIPDTYFWLRASSLWL